MYISMHDKSNVMSMQSSIDTLKLENDVLSMTINIFFKNKWKNI